MLCWLPLPALCLWIPEGWSQTATCYRYHSLLCNLFRQTLQGVVHCLLWELSWSLKEFTLGKSFKLYLEQGFSSWALEHPKRWSRRDLLFMANILLRGGVAKESSVGCNGCWEVTEKHPQPGSLNTLCLMETSVSPQLPISALISWSLHCSSSLQVGWAHCGCYIALSLMGHP